MYIFDYGEEVYNILSDIVKLKFKAQIKGSGIELKKICKVIDLVSNEESYLLLGNNFSLVFWDRADFIDEFIKLLRSNIARFSNEFEELNKRANETLADENAIYMEHEYIGVCSSKQSILLERFIKFKQQIINIDQQ